VIQVPVELGDRAVLYTDGIIEATNLSEEMYGEDRFKQFLEINSSLGADEFSEALLDELLVWSGQLKGQGQKDDITLLTVDFKNH
jgi:sigma-B regulation protein RsbU (phosphoserine phosphatase)